MSFIHLSTIQPTDGQEEVTNRQPAFIKNDFRNGILLKRGETVELVALRLAFEKVEIIAGVNDTLYFMIGDAPNFCQLEAKIPTGSYTEAGLAEALQRAMNTAMNIPSFTTQFNYSPDGTTLKPYQNAGILVAYNPAQTTPVKTRANFSISFSQLDNDAVGLKTFSRMAGTSNDDTYAMRVPRSGLDDTYNKGIYNGGTDADVWAVNTLVAETDAELTITKKIPSANIVRQFNVGQDFNSDKLGAQCIAQGAESVKVTRTEPESKIQTVNVVSNIVGLLDTEGKITAGTSPSMGYSTTEMMTCFGSTGTPAGPLTTIISELNRNSRTGMLNTSQKIDVPAQYHGHDVTKITLHLNNSSANVMNLVLDIYDAITDATSTNVATRFAGLTPIGQSQTTAVPPTGATGPQDFIIDTDTSALTTFYVVLKVKFAGSSSGLSIQGNFGSGTGSNGNMLAELKHEVEGQTPATAGSATADREWTLIYDKDGTAVEGTVTTLAGDNSSNYWNFQFDFATDPNAPISAFDGVLPDPNRQINRLYGVFSPNTNYNGNIEAGGLFWGVGGGNDGTVGGPPPDARDPVNWTFYKTHKGDNRLDISTFYYLNDIEVDGSGVPLNGSFERKAFYASTLLDIELTPEVKDYYRVAWNTEGINGMESPASTYTPSFYRTDGANVNLTADKFIGYNPLRVGFNRRVREVVDDYTSLNYFDPIAKLVDIENGQQGISVKNHKLCDYFVQIKNEKTDGTTKEDPTTGGIMPVIEISILERLEDKPLYPDEGNIVTQVVYEEFLDVSTAGYDATEDLVIQVRINNFNKILFDVGLKDQQDPKRASLIAPRGANQTNMVNLYTTTDTGITATTQIKQSHYPLIATVAPSRGGHYMVYNSVDQASVNTISSYVWVDGMLSIPDPDLLNKTHIKQTRDLYPKASFGDDVPIDTKKYDLTSMFKFGPLTHFDSSPPTGYPPTDIRYYKNYQKDKVLSEYITSNNLANINRIFGYQNLLNEPIALPLGLGPTGTNFDSTEKLRTHPLTDVFNIELLSEPVKSHNGARGDLGKSIYTLTAEEVEIDEIDRIISFTPKTRLPVELNLVEDKTVYSLTVAIKDVNNQLINGLRPPSDVTLFKALPEGTRIERAVNQLKDVIQGKNNDRNSLKISNIGQGNPLLGIIPR